MPGGSSDSVRIFWPELSREELIRRIREGIKSVLSVLPITKVILFGSYARARHTAASDVDLLVVYRGPKRQDDYSICWEALGIPQLELHIYTEEEYERLRSRGSLLPREAEEKGIVVWPVSHRAQQ